MDTPTKRCACCNAEYPATTDFFHKKHDTKDGLHQQCKGCRIAKNKERYYKDVEKSRAYAREIYEQHRDKKRARRKELYPRYAPLRNEAKRRKRLENPKLARSQRRDYVMRNHERIKELKRLSYARNIDKEREKMKQRRITNPEYFRHRSRKYYYEHKELLLRKNKEYRSSEHGKQVRRVLNRNRKARLKNAEGKHTKDDIIAQYKRQNGHCYWCGKKVGDLYHVDHVIPVSRGGSNNPDNLVIACPVCNTSRKNKLPHEWAKGGKLI